LHKKEDLIIRDEFVSTHRGRSGITEQNSREGYELYLIPIESTDSENVK